MAVPNNTTFNFFDVADAVYGSHLAPKNLYDTINVAQTLGWDPNYSGSKNSLLNFQDYGGYVWPSLSATPTSHAGTGSFTVTVTASSSTTWTASAGSQSGWIVITGGGPKTGNGTFSVNILAYPTGGSAKSGTIAITSNAPTFNISITRP